MAELCKAQVGNFGRVVNQISATLGLAHPLPNARNYPSWLCLPIWSWCGGHVKMPPQTPQIATAAKPSTGFLPVRKCTSSFYRHETHTDRPAERVRGDLRCARLPVTPTNERREERRHSKRGRNFDDQMLAISDLTKK